MHFFECFSLVTNLRQRYSESKIFSTLFPRSLINTTLIPSSPRLVFMGEGFPGYKARGRSPGASPCLSHLQGCTNCICRFRTPTLYPTRVQHFTSLDHLNQAPVRLTFVVRTPYRSFQILDASSLTIAIIGRSALGLVVYTDARMFERPLALTPPECPPAHRGILHNQPAGGLCVYSRHGSNLAFCYRAGAAWPNHTVWKHR